ncbi:hypothetical protein Tco_0488500 [Tanacetum coccineum]
MAAIRRLKPGIRQLANNRVNMALSFILTFGCIISDGSAAIQAQLNNLGREIKKVNERVYATRVGCELYSGPHYSKDCPLKEEEKTLEEAYYTQF